MVRADVYPRDQVLLRDVLSVEELVEVDDGRAGEVLIPHATACRLRLLALADREVVTSPVRILEQALRPDNSLTPS